MSQESIIMSQEELKQLAGASQKRIILQYLNDRKINYDINHSNNIIVLRDSVKEFLSTKNGNPSDKSKPSTPKKLVLKKSSKGTTDATAETKEK